MEKLEKQKNRNIFQRIILALDSIHFGVYKEREYLLDNLSMLIAGGMSVLSALEAMQAEIRSRTMSRILSGLKSDIENGSSLWKAFQSAKIFRGHTISLIKIGEESGKLSDNLKLVAAQEAKDRVFKSKVKGAMMYPVFVLMLTVFVGVVVAWFILPRLANVFSQLKVELPLITKLLIDSGQFLEEKGYIAFPVFFLTLGILVYILFFFSKTKFIGQSFLFFLPGIKRLIQEVEIARFGYLMGTLLQAGIPIIDALDSLERATTFPHYKKFYSYLKESISDGNSFQKSFSGYKNVSSLIPIPIQQLVVAGEQSGNLSDTLMNISSNFEAKTEQTTKNISVILEPILLVIVWLGVVAVALAVILPIYSLIGGLNTNPTKEIQEETTTAQKELPLPPEIDLSEPEDDVPKLRVLDTNIGYLNIRDKESTEGEIIGRAYPGEEYEYLDKKFGWYQIVFDEQTTSSSSEQIGDTLDIGWVYSEYVEIIEKNTQ